MRTSTSVTALAPATMARTALSVSPVILIRAVLISSIIIAQYCTLRNLNYFFFFCFSQKTTEFRWKADEMILLRLSQEIEQQGSRFTWLVLLV